MKSMATDFLSGFFSLWNAWKFVTAHARLLRYALIPFVINVVVFAVALYWGSDLFAHLVGDYIHPQDGWWWQALAWLVKALAALITAIFVFFAFTVVGNLIASPFNEALSEKTEQLLTGAALGEEKFSLGRLLKDAGRIVLDEIRKMSIFIVLMLLLVVLSFIPVVGPPVYAVCSVLLTLYFLVVEYTGFVFGRKRLRFADQRRFVAAHRWRSLGFGVAVLCILMIPLVQFLTIPLAVVAATQFCCEKGLCSTRIDPGL
ncbi:MAG: sulfate transporter CysZ [Desulfuromonadaceae bacterium]|nr:sulfate transporter CysZ [Desulfuromonadaceae bacterium]